MRAWGATMPPTQDLRDAHEGRLPAPLLVVEPCQRPLPREDTRHISHFDRCSNSVEQCTLHTHKKDRFFCRLPCVPQKTKVTQRVTPTR